MNKELFYKVFEKMIKSFAFKYHLKTGIDYQELLSEGNLIFCQCLKTFDEKKSSFSTHLYISLKGNFNNYIRKELERQKMINSLICTNNTYIEPKNIKENISNDINIILDILKNDLNNSMHFSTKYKKHKSTKYGIMQYLRSIGWTLKRIDNAFADIKLLLKENAI